MKAPDMTGQRFGRLVVLSKAEPETRYGRTNARWLCRCECGTEKIILAIGLRAGQHRSCGCWKAAGGYQDELVAGCKLFGVNLKRLDARAKRESAAKK